MAVFVVGCTKPQMANTCPESKDTRCVTTVQCERDETRQCMVCRCAPPPYDRKASTLPPSASPLPD